MTAQPLEPEWNLSETAASGREKVSLFMDEGYSLVNKSSAACAAQMRSFGLRRDRGRPVSATLDQRGHLLAMEETLQRDEL